MTLELNATHDPARRSWVETANESAADFPVQNLPIGTYTVAGEKVGRVGFGIGDQIFDLSHALAAGLLTGDAQAAASVACESGLKAAMALGHQANSALRAQVFASLDAQEHPQSFEARRIAQHLLVPASTVEMQLPCTIGNFADFLSSIEHLERARAATAPLKPVPDTFHQLPLAYNGRASSIRVAPHAFPRPRGQWRLPDETMHFGPSQAMDFEMELGAFVGERSELDAAVSVRAANRHIFGYCLLNDWSARDIQRWESDFLGPFLGKSFRSVVSPWIVSEEAMLPFKTEARKRTSLQTSVMAHLDEGSCARTSALDIVVQAWISSEAMRATDTPPLLIASSNLREMYWTYPQIVAHQTSNGCDLSPGDLLGSGTISGPSSASRGCLAEHAVPIALPDGTSRKWLSDGDEITFRATARREGYVSIGFGECRSQILPAVVTS